MEHRRRLFCSFHDKHVFDGVMVSLRGAVLVERESAKAADERFENPWNVNRATLSTRKTCGLNQCQFRLGIRSVSDSRSSR